MNMKEFLIGLTANGLIRDIATALILLVIGVLAIRIIGKLLRRSLEKSKLEKAAHRLITSLVATALYILLGLTVVSTLGIDVTSIVALASVLTLALSLALQNMMANVIGGFTILYTQPFHSGDYVEIAGQGGTVNEINMTYTELITPDRKRISIPNSAVVAAQIVNYSAEEVRRVEVIASVNSALPVETVTQALLEAGNVEGVLADPAPAAVVTGYAEGAVNYSLRLWTKNEDYWDVYFLVNRRVKEIFDARDIRMAYSHVHVHMDR